MTSFRTLGAVAALAATWCVIDEYPLVVLSIVLGALAAAGIRYAVRRSASPLHHAEFERRGVHYEQLGGDLDCNHDNRDSVEEEGSTYRWKCLDCKAIFNAARIEPRSSWGVTRG